MVTEQVKHTSNAARGVGKVTVMDGNKAAAYGALLSRVQVLAAYPITPQTPLVEYLSQFVADGALKADFVEVESEHSSLSVLHGASLAGARTFTATSGQGLALMYEPYNRTPTIRLPIVMGIATRDGISPQCVWGGHQDAINVRDAGWIQLFVEDNQEILDTVIMAYKIAEHPDVLLPVNVCYDGFYLSHMADRVEIPPQEIVDEFLPPYRPTHQILDPDNPMSIDPLTPNELFMEYRYKHLQALQRAKQVIADVDQEFASLFGRGYGGLIEKYRMDDAEIAIVGIGSPVGTARVAVDRARDEGKKIGLVKVRALRPFPREELVEALRNVRAVGVIDKNVCFGWGTGVLFMELRSAMLGVPKPPATVGFIDGLGGSDITMEHYARAIAIVDDSANGLAHQEITWLGLEEE
ncbi:MAG: pyruvate ferredoxin oxidoreductase [Dehalococcoidales bacterium]|nr:pyruvate ferredoxin oxidoreductase [Dehalococcoidales bacterium]